MANVVSKCHCVTYVRVCFRASMQRVGVGGHDRMLAHLAGLRRLLPVLDEGCSRRCCWSVLFCSPQIIQHITCWYMYPHTLRGCHPSYAACTSSCCYPSSAAVWLHTTLLICTPRDHGLHTTLLICHEYLPPLLRITSQFEQHLQYCTVFVLKNTPCEAILPHINGDLHMVCSSNPKRQHLAYVGRACTPRDHTLRMWAGPAQHSIPTFPHSHIPTPPMKGVC